MDKIIQKQHVLVAGANKTAWSICICILQAGHYVTLFSKSTVDALKNINQHIIDVNKIDGRTIAVENLNIMSKIPDSVAFDMVIAITNENLSDKRSIILELENNVAAGTLIAINTESIALSTLQQQARFPERLVGANWTEPVHTTYFLEIITNAVTDTQLVNKFYNTAKKSWQKDPYILKSDTGIRFKMMAALIREAFYLIENDYVTIEDVDRACRNDAGYYLP
ncbi:MAG: 3-hydroxyacyl-CoA dehydrogenase, partial [Sphingobacteriaceae bacterium]